MKICWITDMGVSGYRNLSTPLCTKLAEAGHEIKVLGLGYQREEHWYPFSVIPCQNYNHIFAMTNNLLNMWDFDLMIVALDIPLQERIMQIRERVLAGLPGKSFKYWGIFPVEAPPLSRAWAHVLGKMDHQFIISEFGTAEANDKGISATYLPIGLDTEAWRLPVGDERSMLRGSWGLAEDEFVILTVADNQERKFLSRTAQIIREFKVKTGTELRWILVTREHLEVGWNINSLLSDHGLLQDTFVVERGIPFKELWSLYAMSDCFLLTSKTEGLGLPALEAMCVGTPVAATDCTGLADAMRNGGGFPITPEQAEVPHIDPFGNSYRYFASVESGVRQLMNIKEKQGTDVQVRNARGYVETLTWDRSAQVLKAALDNEHS